jgi:DNA-binding transcriptional LysR family regulator
MQIETLQFFCDVVRLKNFTRAAEANGVTQSTISQAVQQVEKEFNARLIDRSTRPLNVTQEGRICYKRFVDIISRYVSLKNSITTGDTVEISRVSISAIYSVGLSSMHHFITRYTGENPKVQVNLEYQHPDEVYRSVRRGDVDLGIISFPDKDPTLEVKPWRRERMMIVMSPDTKLNKEGDSMELSHIDMADYIGFDSGLKIRREVDRFLSSRKVSPTIVLEFDNIESIKRAVETGTGVAILPEPTVRREVTQGTLREYEISGEDFVRPLGIIQRRNAIVPACVADFIQLLMKGKEENDII